jgi:hypothetical protein
MELMREIYAVALFKKKLGHYNENNPTELAVTLDFMLLAIV